ncbi:hypothetical protein BC831DRAFT_442178 [Entophlyctis helioformis]|nr:hypothetical protein BC831DRAFT_442178 [Entophlyctis helioformis]
MGKLNILQHKSWHVYSEKNRQRVRRDEEDAARAEAEKRDRADKADQEARIQLLRSRARGASADSQQAEQASLGDDASGWQAQASTADSKASNEWLRIAANASNAG